jgi:acyl-ACP thioesterase
MSTTAGLRDQGLPSPPKTRYKEVQTIPAAAWRKPRQGGDMKAVYPRTVGYAEVDPNFNLKPGALVNLLQAAAIFHSEKIGFGIRALRRQSLGWVLNRLALDIQRVPAYGERLEIVTWFRGAKRFRAYRDFEIYAGPARIAAATSLWLFCDVGTKKLSRISEEMITAYTVETDRVFARDLDRWEADCAFAPALAVPLTTRASDFDPNGHVNNAVYFDYLQTLLYRAQGPGFYPRGLAIQFSREIDARTTALTAGLSLTAGALLFKLFEADAVFAAGGIYPDAPPLPLQPR